MQKNTLPQYALAGLLWRNNSQPGFILKIAVRENTKNTKSIYPFR